MAADLYNIFRAIGHFLFIVIIVFVIIPAFYFGNEGVGMMCYFAAGFAFLVWLFCLLIRGLTKKDARDNGLAVLIQLISIMLIFIFGVFFDSIISGLISTFLLAIAIGSLSYDVKNVFKNQV